MIAKKIAKRTASSFGKLADYLAAASDKGEKLDDLWLVNCAAGDEIDAEDIDQKGNALEDAKTEIAMTQGMNTRCRSDKTYHLLISFRDEKPSPEALREIEAEFAKALGFADHQRIAATHANTDNFHMHVAINRVHPETWLLHNPSHDFRALQKVCRAMEQKHDLKIDRGIKDVKDHTKLHTQAADFEAHRWEQSFLSYAREQKPKLDAARGEAKSWSDLHAAFAERGMVLKASGNGLIVQSLPEAPKQAAKTPSVKTLSAKTPSVKIHSVKASDLGRDYSKAALETEFGTFKPAQTQSKRPKQSYSKKAAPGLIKPATTARLFRRYAGTKKSQNWKSFKQFFNTCMTMDMETALLIKAQGDMINLPLDVLRVFSPQAGGRLGPMRPEPVLPPDPPDIASEFLTRMERGRAPWQHPQDVHSQNVKTSGKYLRHTVSRHSLSDQALSGQIRVQEPPYNPISNTPYEGMNALWLAESGRDDQRWLTEAQLKQLGTKPKRFEKPTVIEHWSFSTLQTARDKDGKVIHKDGKPVTRRAHLDQPKISHISLYNAEQVRHPHKLPPTRQPVDRQQNRANARAKRILKGAGIALRRDQQSRSFHDSVSDTLHLRSTKEFRSLNAYHGEAIRTLCEAISRRTTDARDKVGADQSQLNDSKLSQLRCDIAAHMVCKQLGLQTPQSETLQRHTPHSKTPTADFTSALKADPSLFYTTCREAETIASTVMDCEDREKRQFLNVPLTQAKEVKALGAKFDIIDRAFYVPETIEITNTAPDTSPDFSKWLRDDPAKRIPLKVPHKDKDAVKKLGARWNSDTKHPHGPHWYVPGLKDIDVKSFESWLQKEPTKHTAQDKAQEPAPSTRPKRGKGRDQGPNQGPEM